MAKMNWGRARERERLARSGPTRLEHIAARRAETLADASSGHFPKKLNRSGRSASVCLSCGRGTEAVFIVDGLLADGCPNVKVFCGHACAVTGGYPWAGLTRAGRRAWGIG